MRLKDKVAIVTGGASGIGRAIALGFAREGARVAIADINLEGSEETVAGIRNIGQKGLAIKTDVCDPEQIRAMAAAVYEEFGRLDILVNSAAVLEEVPMLESTVEQWDKTLDINVRGTMICIQEALKVMTKQGSGKIINISSIAAFRGRPMQQAYCASKAGIIALTQSVAMQMAHLGINVNAIAPGYIDTPFPESLNHDPEALKRKIDMIPAGRAGRPEDIAGPAIFLASDESDYVNGATIVVDGGSTIRLTGVTN